LFIDPIPDQPLGGNPAAYGDNLPSYDTTAASKVLLGNTRKWYKGEQSRNYKLSEAICDEDSVVVKLVLPKGATPEPPTVVMMRIAMPLVLVLMVRRRHHRRCTA
jgi:hypothetical protein